METYLLLIISFGIAVVTYFDARSFKWSMLFYLFPEKYLIKNKRILRYLMNPKNRVPISLFILHLSNLIPFLIILILYILAWCGVLPYSIFTTKWIYLAYITNFFVFFIPIAIIHGTMYLKYIEKKGHKK